MLLQVYPGNWFNTSIVNLFQEYYEPLFKDFRTFIEMVENFAARLPDYLFWLPTPIAVLFVVAFGVAVLLMILGKEP